MIEQIGLPTQWDFGHHQTNILMVVAGYGHFVVPIYWEMLDNNSGNSSCQHRIDLLSLCIDLIGAQRIGLVIGDREFVGQRWFSYLKNKTIPFIMRLPKHHKIHRCDGRIQTVEALGLIENKSLTMNDCMVDGVVGNVWVRLTEDGDYLFLFGTVQAKFMGQLYRKRWGIEACSLRRSDSEYER